MSPVPNWGRHKIEEETMETIYRQIYDLARSQKRSEIVCWSGCCYFNNRQHYQDFNV